MPHSFNKLWVHAIWSTKHRAPLITPTLEQTLFSFVSEQLQELGCVVCIINGMPDHIHCLFLLSPQKSIADVVKQVKGSSSHYVNQHNLIAEKFAWQTGYAAFSVSESVVEKVYHYILNQKAHHRKVLFAEEYEAFLRLNGLQEEKNTETVS